jgi:hypothetical protein
MLGCSSAPEPLVDGSRLKAMWWQDGDGHHIAPAGDGWYDSQLKIPCTPGGADDGRLRCLPKTFVGATGSAQEYADPGCTQPAIGGGFPVPAPGSSCHLSFDPVATGWARGPAPPPSCGSSYPWVQIGTVLPAGAMVYRRDTSGMCAPSGALPAGYAYTISAPVPASTFVAFADPVPFDGGRLRPAWRVADDGARSQAGVWDAMRNEACVPDRAADGRLRCLPSATSISFVDPACSQPAVISSGVGICGYGGPRYGVTTSQAADCEPQTSSIYQVGDELPAPGMVYFGTPGQCQGYAASGARAWAVGAEVPPDAFAELTEKQLTHGRVVETVLAWGDDVLVRGRKLHDTELDVDVEPSPLSPTVNVLLPVDRLHGDPYYVDAGCTQAVAVTGGTCGFSPSVMTVDSDDANGCFVRKAYPVGPVVSPSALYQGRPGACQQVALPSAPLVALGAELPPETFVRIGVAQP